MYDIISNIISHSWSTNTSGEQSYIYYICGSVICLLVVVFIDFVRQIFASIFGR